MFYFSTNEATRAYFLGIASNFIVPRHHRSVMMTSMLHYVNHVNFLRKKQLQALARSIIRQAKFKKVTQIMFTKYSLV